MISILIVLVVLGIVWMLIGPYVAEPFRTVIVVVVLLCFCVWLLGLVGVNVPHISLR